MDKSTLFDRPAVRRAQRRAVRTGDDGLFLFDEVAQRLADRLLDIQRSFPILVDLSGRGDAVRQLAAVGAMKARNVEQTVRIVESKDFVANQSTIVADLEMPPLADASVNLALSVLSFHALNDLPGTLVQLRRALRPDGLLLAALFGGETLGELRTCLEQAEIEVTGGVSPRVIPFADVRDIGGLMQRTGYALPVTDVDRISITYESPKALMKDLRLMGETNPMRERSKLFLRRDVLRRTEELYWELYGAGERVPATFDIVYLTGWAPHESQQKPLRPGQATSRLADALGATERPAGDKATPRK